MDGASDCGMSGRNEKAERAGTGETSGSVSCTGKDVGLVGGKMVELGKLQQLKN